MLARKSVFQRVGWRLLSCGMVGLLLGAVAAWAQQSAGLSISPADLQAGRRLYGERIRPVLETQCLMCHQGPKSQGGLDVASREGLLKGGQSGPGVMPGNASVSLLYKLVTHQQQPAMPYKMAKLTEAQIASIAEWINKGVPYEEPAGGAKEAAQVVAAVSSPAGQQFFEQVRPVLEQQCLLCHGGKFKQAGLNVLTRETLLKGSDTGAVVVPGKAEASLLIKKIRHEHDPGMPYQKPKLAEEAIARITEWVNAGVPYERPLELPASSELSQRPGSEHWAFQVPKRPAVPKVKNAAWVRNPIDRFVAAEQQKHGLKPLPEAEKRVLLRRVYLDLIGLPPTVEQLQAFLADRSPDAYERVVDQLLASPQYGERWGRHWMDVWRYMDPVSVFISGAVRTDYSYPGIWRWRDWIIESLNEDKGYDRMILEMLAGDEIAPADPKVLRATGYLARSFYRFSRNVWMHDIAEYTSASFLGMTLKCARCHDHKYDPIAQEEYYRFRAFFEPYDVRTDRVVGKPELQELHGLFANGLPRAFDGEPKEALNVAPFLPAIFGQTYRFIRGDEKTPDTEHPLAPSGAWGA